MALQRRQRATELDSGELDEAAATVLISAIGSVLGTGEIWEPFMSLPIDSTADVEEASVRASVARLISRMDTADTRGVGLMREAGLSQ